MASTGMLIDGALGSQCVDSSGEILDVEGADIIDLEEGRGVLNYEHQSSEEKNDKGDHKNQGQEIVGKILTAKKIFKESDCENSRQRHFWKKVKHPFIYGVCRLYDGAGHEGAKALAAQIRDHHANGEPILVRFSVEGSTLEKVGNTLKQSVIRRVALTLKPCNRTADSGLLEDPNAPEGWAKKFPIDLDKSEHVHPLYRKLGGEFVTEYVPLESEEDTEDLERALFKLRVLRKALTAGSMDVAPSQLTGGAALQREDLIKLRKKGLGTLKSFLDKNDSFTRDQARAALKAELPEASDDFIDHFADIAEDYRIKLRKTESNEIPLDRLAVNDRSLMQAFKNVKRGLGSRTDGPISVWRDPSGDLLVVDGHHRLVHHLLSGAHGGSIPGNVVGTGDSDYLRPTGSDRAPLKPDDRFGGLDKYYGGGSWLDETAKSHGRKLRKKDDALESDYPKLNPDIGGGIGGEKPRVDLAAEPKGVVPAERKGGLEMKPGGKLMVGKPGAKPGVRVGVQQFFPEDEHYHALLKPEQALADGTIDGETFQSIVKTVHEPWHRAMTHWLPLNQALSEGKLPKGILAKSVIFAAMSPNTSVPLQERYYGHYMDMLHEGKVDPFREMSEDAIRDFTKRSTDGRLPEWNREYYEAHPLGINTGGDAVHDDAPADDKGELPQILGLRNSHKLYPYLEHLVAKHRDDTQQIAAELMDMKHEHNKYKLATDIDRRQGRTVDRQAPDHTRTLGYGPKLTRYLLGMMGGGNMIVPDRHMVRSTFDLSLMQDPNRAGKFTGTPLLDKLQTSVVTKAQNEKFMRAMDHNFFTKHPAVKHVLETFPKHFKGREHQAIFPAFWLHWLTIGHHDRMRGRPFVGFNSDTDHSVFWDSVRDEMIKHGLHPHPLNDKRPKLADEDTSFDFSKSEKLDLWPRHKNHLNHPVWLKAAGVLQALRQRWGENPALFAFFSHVMPHVMKAETPVPPVTHVPHASYHPHLAKAEALIINLRKAMAQQEGDHPALDEVAPHIHHVYRYAPGQDLKIRRHLTGRFLTAGNHVHVLEDYHGHLNGMLSEGPHDDFKAQQIDKLRNHHKFEVIPLSDIRGGKHPELWDAAQVRKPAPRPTAFEYLRHGQTRADHLEYVNGAPHLNGHPLNDEQVRALHHHLKNNHAVIRYKRTQPAVAKMEALLVDLMKADSDVASQVHEALGRLDQLVKDGHLEPHHAEALRNHAFKDPMTGHTMGNKFAYTDFLNRSAGKGGIHIAMDGNDFKSVNDKFGHETGDRAIKSFGSALRAAMDEVAPGEGKLFRTGGDEFAAHVPSHDHAAAFARSLRSKLEALTPIEGNHRLSMSLGFGDHPGSADQALYHAKDQKLDAVTRQSKYAKGSAPNMAHSLVPGFEGAIPLDSTAAHVTPPPTPAPPEPPPAPVTAPAAPQPASSGASPAAKPGP